MLWIHECVLTVYVKTWSGDLLLRHGLCSATYFSLCFVYLSTLVITVVVTLCTLAIDGVFQPAP